MILPDCLVVWSMLLLRPFSGDGETGSNYDYCLEILVYLVMFYIGLPLVLW